MNRPTISDLARAAGVEHLDRQPHSRRLGIGPPRDDPAGSGGSRTRSASMEWGSSTRARRTRSPLSSRLPAAAIAPRMVSADGPEDPGGGASSAATITIEPVIEFADRLDPENIAARLMALGEACDAVSVIAADHPLVSQAIQTLKAKGQAGRRLHHRSVRSGPRRLRRHRQLETRSDRGLVHRPDHPRAGTGSGLHRQSPIPVPGHIGRQLSIVCPGACGPPDHRGQSPDP